MGNPILSRTQIEICGVIFLLETNFPKAVIFLSLPIIKMKSYCFGNQLFEATFFYFGPKMPTFHDQVKIFEKSMASVASH